MSTLAVSSDLLQLSEVREIRAYAEKMAAEIPTAFYSKPELGHRLAGEDKTERSICYRLIDALAEAGITPSLNAWHNTWPLKIVFVDNDSLRKFVAGLG